MKSLDINSASTNLSVDASQRVTIEFTGGNHFDRMQGANTVTIPYSSLSQRLQAIHRFGGKITNISIQRLQLDRPRINSEVDSAQDQVHVLEETPAIAPIVEPEKISEIIPEIIVKDVSVNGSNNILKDVPDNIPEVALPVSTSKTQKPFAETTVKSKKSIASTKASHGFSKKESSPQVLGTVSAIAETVPVPEPVVEIIPEISPEPIAEPILEKAKPLSEAAIKPKKARTSPKAGHGFSKKESSPQVSEPVVIAEIVSVPEPVVEIIPEVSPEQVSDSTINNSSVQDLKQIELTSDHTSNHNVTEAVLASIVEPVLEASVEHDFEATVPVSKAENTVESTAPESTAPLPPSKSKKSKPSSKSGSGFNKPKSDTQTPRSQRKPKI